MILQATCLTATEARELVKLGWKMIRQEGSAAILTWPNPRVPARLPSEAKSA
jgi:predicted RNA binding protein YcfA (HicA-like mRNA interferase family)